MINSHSLYLGHSLRTVDVATQSGVSIEIRNVMECVSYQYWSGRGRVFHAYVRGHKSGPGLVERGQGLGLVVK